MLTFNQLIRPRLIRKPVWKNAILALALVFLFDCLFFPLPILAAEYEAESPADLLEDSSWNNGMAPEDPANSGQDMAYQGQLPVPETWAVKKAAYYTITAYNSEIGQTDASPCTTANGFDVCAHGTEDTMAANFLPFGAKVRIPDLFGERVFVVRDRMNARFTQRLDVWMKSKANAKDFGVKVARVEILE